MIYLTIINTIAIIYILTHKQFSLHKNTAFGGTLVGYGFYFNRKRFIYIPLKNQHRVEVNEDIHRMISGTEQSKRQILGAKFSWLKTIPEVEQFRKDYEVVDRKLVNSMVDEFILNHR